MQTEQVMLAAISLHCWSMPMNGSPTAQCWFSNFLIVSQFGIAFKSVDQLLIFAMLISVLDCNNNRTFRKRNFKVIDQLLASYLALTKKMEDDYTRKVLARVQRVHKLADLWDITFFTR